MAIINAERGKLTRWHIENNELNGAEITAGSEVSEIMDYFDGNERTYILEKYAERYCERITKSEDGTYFQGESIVAAKAAVDTGKFEIVTLGTGTKIKRIVGSLNRDTEFSYVTEGGDEDEEFTKDMATAREDAGFDLKLGRMEEIAVLTGGTAGCLVQQLGHKLDYQPLLPNQIKIVFATEILENDEPRPTNTLEIEEATLVVLQMSAASETRFNYVAYFPRSDRYPDGRMVKYEAVNWYDIPDVDDPGAVDHLVGNGVANPLTVLQDNSGDYSLPEIPVVLWYGSPDGAGAELMPISTNLYEADKEINLDGSRQMFAVVRSATGVIAFTTELGGSPIVSDNIGEGLSKLEPGQSLNILQVPGANSDALMKSIEKNIAYLGESYAIPSYKLAVGANTTVPSGAALIEMNRPENNYRQARANINRGNMRRMFDVERGIAAVANDDSNFGAGIRQVWTVNTIDIAKTDEEKLAYMTGLKSAGVIDNRELVRRTLPQYKDATDEEIDMYLDGLKKAPSVPAAGTGRFGRAQAAARDQQPANTVR